MLGQAWASRLSISSQASVASCFWGELPPWKGGGWCHLSFRSQQVLTFQRVTQATPGGSTLGCVPWTVLSLLAPGLLSLHRGLARLHINLTNVLLGASLGSQDGVCPERNSLLGGCNGCSASVLSEANGLLLHFTHTDTCVGARREKQQGLLWERGVLITT